MAPLAAVEPVPFEISTATSLIRGESSGEGIDMVLCHGLSATRRYVVHGSKVLPRNGFRLHVFDARGHGESEPATEYTYGTMADDLGQVIDQLGLELPIVLGGHSMGCHTALTYALADPGRVAALILAGPAFTGEESDLELDRWDRRAGALESGGAAEFARVVGSQVDGPDEVRKKITELARSRAELHRHPEAVAEALRQVPRSAPFSSVRELEMLDLPALVVGSHDEFDDGHPYAVARRYAHALPQAKMISEERGESPLSWQGGRLSREIASFLELLGTADADG